MSIRDDVEAQGKLTSNLEILAGYIALLVDRSGADEADVVLIDESHLGALHISMMRLVEESEALSDQIWERYRTAVLVEGNGGAES